MHEGGSTGSHCTQTSGALGSPEAWTNERNFLYRALILLVSTPQSWKGRPCQSRIWCSVNSQRQEVHASAMPFYAVRGLTESTLQVELRWVTFPHSMGPAGPGTALGMASPRLINHFCYRTSTSVLSISASNISSLCSQFSRSGSGRKSFRRDGCQRRLACSCRLDDAGAHSRWEAAQAHQPNHREILPCVDLVEH
jgi:hypothetical protein